MVSKLVCSALALALSIGWSVSAQTQAPKRPPAKKAPAPAKTRREDAPGARSEPQPPPPTDVQIHSKLINGAQISESTTYFKGVRQRFEFPGITMISQCDLKRGVQLHTATKRYLVTSTEPTAHPPPPTPAAEPETPTAARSGRCRPRAGAAELPPNRRAA